MLVLSVLTSSKVTSNSLSPSIVLLRNLEDSTLALLLALLLMLLLLLLLLKLVEEGPVWARRLDKREAVGACRREVGGLFSPIESSNEVAIICVNRRSDSVRIQSCEVKISSKRISNTFDLTCSQYNL